MKKVMSILCIFFTIIQSTELDTDQIQDHIHIIVLSEKEIDAILESDKQFAYFGPEVCTLINDFSTITNQISADLPFFNQLNAIINNGNSTAPHDLIKFALDEIMDYLSAHHALISELEIQAFLININNYYQKLESGEVDIIIDGSNDIIKKNRRFKFVRTLITNKLRTNSLNVNNDTVINGVLTVNGSQIINGDLTVLGELDTVATPLFSGSIEIQGEPQQGCIIFVDENMTEKARICSSAIFGEMGLFISTDNGITENFRINNEGGIVIAPPSSGVALSVTGNTAAAAITATGNGTNDAPALRLIGNPPSDPTDSFLTIDDSGVVKQAALTATNLIINGCQAGPLIIGTSDATSLSLATGSAGICNPRLTIDENGAVTINKPASGEALTVTGNIVLPSANSNATEGILKLGGSSGTEINVYQFGTRNFFAGNGAINSTLTGTDNISIGKTANSSLTTANNSIAIGSTAQATGSDSISLGNAAQASAARAIAIGSTDSSSTGAAPTATNTNAIAIGSASGTNAGASASGVSAVAVGGADSAIATGADASGDRSIAIGVNAQSSAPQTITLGSASGTSGGLGPIANNNNAIAIGSANGSNAGPIATGIASVAIGSAIGSGSFAGAVASGDRSVALGANTTSSNSGAIAIGSASGTTGGTAATANGIGAIAIGSSNSAAAGASATGIAAIAIGSANGTTAGASASGDRSVAIGNGASTAQSDAIVLGNSAATGVRVGIGTNTPAAKLDVVGANLTPVFRMDQVTNSTANAPLWLNPSTSAGAGTPIYYDSSNRLFGFISSARYKTNIRPLESQSEILYKLNPVVYDAKEGHGEGHDIAGFIAEEVYMIAPYLVVLNSDGQPENVAYNSLHALAIKELQKQQQQIDAQNTLVANQASIIDTLLNTVQQLQETILSLEASV